MNQQYSMRWKSAFSLCCLACTVFALTSKSSAADIRSYPQGFLWGTALSAHQIEGATGGGENGDWWLFEHSQAGATSIIQGQTADLAADHWNRYRDDLEIAQKIGVNTLQISVSWEKIEPSSGVFSSSAIQHYRDVLLRMRELNIRPVIVLHHFTHPQWFHDRGGWLSPESPRIFLEYAAYVAKNLGDLCDLWITFNDPIYYVIQGYIQGDFPPFISSVDSAYEAAFQIARAHRMAAQVIHDIQGCSPGAHGSDGNLRGVGITLHAQLFEPENPSSAKNHRLADGLSEMINWSLIHGITSGVLRFNPPNELPYARKFERNLPLQDLPPWDVGPTIDWLGVNYQTRHLVRVSPSNPLGFTLHAGTGPAGDNGWAIYPRGLERILRQASQRFTYPLVVTENGIDDLSDQKRSLFLKQHFHSLDQAVFGSRQGPPLDIRGYTYRSLIDGFEWLSGYQSHFGLVGLQDGGLDRQLRPSAQVFSEKIRSSQPRP